MENVDSRDRFRYAPDAKIIALVSIFMVIHDIKKHLNLLGMLFNHLVLDSLMCGDRDNLAL